MWDNQNQTNFTEENQNEWTKNQPIDLGNEGTDFTDFDPFADETTLQNAEPNQQTERSEKQEVAEESKQHEKRNQQKAGGQMTLLSTTQIEPSNSYETAAMTEVKLTYGKKPPVFEYAAAKEEIMNTAITFDALRIEKSKDFPELEDAKRITWTVSYGKITKSVLNPVETSIEKQKADIEKSKEFLDSIKKTKSDIVCKITPKITAQSKGETSSYRGIFPDLETAQASQKPICIVPSKDGNVYEIRSNEIGRFVTKANNTRGLSELRAGFTPALPPIPFEMIAKVISFFRCFMCENIEVEALVNIYWDKQKYLINVPKQTVSKARVITELEEINSEHYIHVADIHSHNSMPAKFSAIDDADEKATRIYIVIGRLDKFFPDISARIASGGSFVDIDPSLVIDKIETSFPLTWLNQVSIENRCEKL